MWGMLHADDAGSVFRSRDNIKKIMADKVEECASFVLAVSEAKTRAMLLVTKRMDRVTFVTEAAASSVQTNRQRCVPRSNGVRER